MSQIERVEQQLKKEGRVSRNYYLDQPYDRITRLGAIICQLRKKGYDIETIETENDTIYTMKPKKIEFYNIILPDGTKQPYSKPVW